MLKRFGLFSFSAGMLLVVWVSVAVAITPDQRKALTEIKNEVGRIPGMLSKSQVDEAEKLLQDAESKLQKMIKEEKLAETDPLVSSVAKQVETQRQLLMKKAAAMGKEIEGSVSFVGDVAPILAKHCLKCHDEKGSGGLRIDTFAGMEKGGKSGPLLIAGNPNSSLLLQRLVAPQANQLMPKGEKALARDEIQKIGTWIREGAKFDGKDKETDLADLGKKATKADNAPVTIAKATGSEKVSFVKDVAPGLVNVCSGCHGGNTPRGGFSMENFEKLMKGGDSGRVIVAGSLEGSRLWRLVNADDEPVMPQGQNRITRKWHADLRTWITEGAKFDGGDPKKPLRQLVPTEEEIKAEKMAKLSPSEWIAMRKKSTEDDFKKTLPSEKPSELETSEAILIGNVSEPRLKQVADWVDETAKSLRSTFNSKDQPLFKGKLGVIVLKDRFSYTEFNQTVHRREVPREVMGHFEVTRSLEEAFIAVQDIGDDVSESSPGLHLSVVENMSGAYLRRGGNLPEWLVRGTGLALAANTKGVGGNAYITGLSGQAGGIVRDVVKKPEDLFANGQFSPSDIGPVGYTLVSFLMRNGGPAKLSQLVNELQSGKKIDAALNSVYKSDVKSLATAYVQTLGARPATTKKK